MTRREEFRADFVGNDQLSPAAARARKRLRELTQQLQELRGKGKINSALESSSKTLDRLTRSTDRAAAAEARRQRQRASGQSDSNRKNLSLELAAIERVNRALRNEEIRRRAVNRLRRQGLDARGRTAEAEAQERVARALRRQAVAQAEITERKRRGLSISEELLRAAGRSTLESRAQAAAERRITQEKLRQLTAQKELELRRREGLEISESLRRAAEGLADSDERRVRAGRNLLFSFRRIATVIASFAAVRGIFAGFTGALRGVIGFQSRLEIAELSIQTLLTATTQLRDSFGDLIPQSEAFARNQSEARRQIALLRRDSLRTLATFDQLVDTFQVAVAPGRAAGLDVDQIRQVSVRISQVAAAIGLAQNQLAEEIRSILSGTIQLRTTRIAAALGITNEDIRNARAQGQLFQFLESQFSAFALAGGKARLTLQGLGATLRDLLGQAGALAGAQFFDSLRRGARVLAEEVIGLGDATRELRPNPAFVSFLKTIFDLFAQGIDAATDFAAGINFAEAGDSLANFLQIVSSFLALITEIGGNLLFLIEGANRAVNALGAIFGGDNLRSLLAYYATFRLLGGASLVTGIIRGLRLIRVNIRLIGRAARRSRASVAALSASLRGLAGFAAASLAVGLVIGIGDAIDQGTDAVNKSRTEIRKFISDADRLKKGLQAAANPEAFRELAEEIERVQTPRRTRTTVGARIFGNLNFDEIGRLEIARTSSIASLAALRKALRDSAFGLQRFVRTAISTSSNVVNDLGSEVGRLTLQLEAFNRLEVIDPERLSGFSVNDAQRQVEAARERERIENSIYEIERNRVGLLFQLDTAATELSESQRKLVEVRERANQRAVDASFRNPSEENSARNLRTLRKLQDAQRTDQQRLLDSLQILRDQEAVQGRIAKINEQLGRDDLISIDRDRLEGQLQREQSALKELNDRASLIRLDDEQKRLVSDIFNTERQLKALQADRAAINEALVKANDRILRLKLAEANADARINRERERARALELSAEAASQGTPGLVGSQEELRRAAQESAIANAQLEAQRIRNRNDLQRLQQRIERAPRGVDISALEQELQLRRQQVAAEESILQFQAQQAEIARARADERANNGFVSGIREFTENIGTLQDGFFRLAQTFTQTLSEGLTQAVVAALQGGDVNAAVNQIGLQFVQAVIQEGINQLLSLILGFFLPSLTTGSATAGTALVTSAAAAANTLAAGGAFAGASMVAGAAQAAALLAAARVGGGGAGLNTGGQARGGLPGRAHAGAPGFDTGGAVPSVGTSTPPPGVSSKDTLAAWLTPGEHVMRTAAVAKYGRSFMDMVNTGRLSASMARSLARGISPSAAPKGPGFNTGGFVRSPQRVRAPARSARAIPTILVTDNQAMDRQMRGGRDAHQQRIGYNPRAMRASLGIL